MEDRACRVTVIVAGERVDGDIGNTWGYTLTGVLKNTRTAARDQLNVPVHVLEPGLDHPAPTGTFLDLRAASPGPAVELRLTLTALEHDWVFPDTGTRSWNIPVRLPEPGGAALSEWRDIVLRVHESPRFLGGTATLTLRLQISATADALPVRGT